MNQSIPADALNIISNQLTNGDWKIDSYQAVN